MVDLIRADYDATFASHSGELPLNGANPLEAHDRAAFLHDVRLSRPANMFAGSLGRTLRIWYPYVDYTGKESSLVQQDTHRRGREGKVRGCRVFGVVRTVEASGGRSI
jgi:hypothetical protein